MKALPTLLFPFERGLVEAPRASERVLFFGAGAGLSLPVDFEASFQIVQDFRPDFLALQRTGFTVVPQAEGDGFDAAMILLGRYRRQNEARLAEALHRVRAGGLIIAAGSKNDGAPSFRKRVAELLTVENALSKYHGTVFWLRRPEMLDNPMRDLMAPCLRTPEEYETAIGGFSEGIADPGSRLLDECLPQDLSGDIADFAAGWGYLSIRMAARFSITRLDLYEAHLPSLDAARRNLAAFEKELPCRFFWHDLLSEPVTNRYDAIVMNPPFHRTRAAEPDIGGAMIGVAAKALKSRGRLFVVANRGLPYEAAMQASFSRHGEIRRDETYKILWGMN